MSDPTAATLRPGDRITITRTVVATIEVAGGRRLIVLQHEAGHEPTITCDAARTFTRATTDNSETVLALDPEAVITANADPTRVIPLGNVRGPGAAQTAPAPAQTPRRSARGQG